jgi:hypothetical protein
MSKEVPFDKRNAAILHATGFSITDEPGHSESACVQGKMALYVVQLADGRLRLSIELPEGSVINAEIVAVRSAAGLTVSEPTSTNCGLDTIEAGEWYLVCRDCRHVLPMGPMLHDELWATIAQLEEFLCLDCIEKRLGRGLTQADLKVCPFNAGWVAFDGADVVALQFARGRQLLPP